MSTKSEKRKILAGVELEVYVGEDNVFVRVVDPRDPTIDNWPDIQRFYRWASAELGLLPEKIWNPKLGYAVLDNRHFAKLSKAFSISIMSKKDFFYE